MILGIPGTLETFETIVTLAIIGILGTTVILETNEETHAGPDPDLDHGRGSPEDSAVLQEKDRR